MCVQCALIGRRFSKGRKRFSGLISARSFFTCPLPIIFPKLTNHSKNLNGAWRQIVRGKHKQQCCCYDKWRNVFLWLFKEEKKEVHQSWLYNTYYNSKANVRVCLIIIFFCFLTGKILLVYSAILFQMGFYRGFIILMLKLISRFIFSPKKDPL